MDTAECKVTQKQDGRYYLTACRLEKLIDDDEVFESAKRLKTMMRAIAKIELGIDCENIDPDDAENATMSYQERLGDTLNTHIRLGKPPSAVGRAFTPTVGIIDEYHNGTCETRKEHWYDYLLNQCDDRIDNTIIFEALSHFAVKNEPRTLRNTYKTIEIDAGGKDRLRKLTGVTETQQSDFTRSSNHPDMEGQKLHVKNPNSKDNFIPISLAKATEFCGGWLLKPWLLNKRELLRLAEGNAQAKHLTNILGLTILFLRILFLPR
jgi:hypothetical protein